MKKLLLLGIFILASTYTVLGQGHYYMENNFAVFKKHPKAKGLDFKILIPNGWRLEEGTRPNVVCKLTRGHSSFTIIIRQNITFLSRKQGKEYFDTGAFDNECLNSSSRLIDPKILSATNTFVDTYPARLVEMMYKMHIPTVNQLYDFHTYSWAVCYEDLLISIQATALEKEFSKQSLNFHQILQNIVFLEHYE